ncbi:Uncharacterised protein [Chromobacterium violaceum]|uniref:Mechanosensitive ion channel MscS C-terminal domain-containing protein n=1 Tax=Chromobacterium violaceum TaxID=536 RepID=A0A447TFX9_CHRVL|nr:Uncharacterised protein [Chromobacterium violaceum]
MLKNPGANAFVTLFADSGINLELGFWVADPENGFMGLKSDINLAIWRLFKQHNIEIPFRSGKCASSATSRRSRAEEIS